MSSTYNQAVEQTITAGEQIHQIVNGTATTEVTVEDGSKVPSIRKALLDNFYFKDPIAWQSGQTENVFNQLRQFTDGSWWYAPSATASNPVSMGSTPVGDSLWKIYDFDAIGKLEPRINEALRRSYAEAGYNLVDGSFEAGGTLVNANDVLLQERTGKAFSGPAGAVAAGTNPTSGGFVDRSGALLRDSVFGGIVAVSEHYPASLDWTNATTNAARIESVCGLAQSKGGIVDVDLPIEIPITGLSAAARDIKKISNVGGAFRTTASSSYYHVHDYRQHYGAVSIPFIERFKPAVFTKTAYGIESSFNFDSILTKAAGTATYYVVGNALAPVGGGDGLTIKTGFSQLQMALNMPDVGEIIVLPQFYNKEESGFIGTPLNKKIIIRCVGGQATFSCSNKGLPWVQLGTSSVWQRTQALTTRIVDKKYKSEINLKNGSFVDFFELKKVNSLAEVQSTPGTFYIDGSNLVSVRLMDDRAVDDDMCAFRDVAYTATDTNGASVLVLDGIIMEGWANGFRPVGSGVLYARNCQFNYSGTAASDGGLMAKGWRAYLDHCGASRNANDGFNYHANGTAKSDAQEFKCFGYKNGSYVYGSPATNKNASTAHDGCQIVRAGCYYSGSLGPVVVDVHAKTKSYNVGVIAKNSVMPNSDNQTARAFEFTSGAVGYLDGCIGTGSEWSILLDSASTAFVRQSVLDGTIFGGNYVRQF